MFGQALHYHLFKYPLYINQDAGECINILIVGFGVYAQKFLDLSLQIGQMHGKTLNVEIVSQDEPAVEKYKQDRPELGNFFRINGHFDGEKEIYGTINFSRTLNEDYNSYYVFVDDASNFELAEKFASNNFCCFVHEGENLLQNLPDNIVPINVNLDITNLPEWREILRMAFNVHRVWYKNLNVDFKSVLSSFNNPYNQSSSISNVLSLKYKLHSVSIDIDSLDYASLEAAAELFTELNNPELFNELMYLEHRRWVTEKICEGWTSFTNLHDALTDGAKDDKHKRHVCICRSKPSDKLDKISHEQWDNINASLDELDELETMSVKLHRLYLDDAEKTRQTDLLNGPEISGIRSILDNNPAALSAFNEWYSCIQAIWNGDTQKVYLHEGRLDALKNSFGNLSSARASEAWKNLNRFTAKFTNILLAYEYRNYKKDDTALIEKIPFILTYSDDICLAVPYDDGESVTSLLGNCAASVVINPAKIIYLCLLESSNQAESLKKTFKLVMRFFKRKNVRAEINFLIGYSERVNISGLRQELKGGKIRRAEFIKIRNEDYTRLCEIIRERSENFVLEKNNTKLAGLLESYDISRHYRFDMLTMNFSEIKGCEIFTYIPRRISISAADMLTLCQAFSLENTASSFSGDYVALWKKYTEANFNDTWKRLCKSLESYPARINLKFVPLSYVKPEELTYYLPVICRPAAERIITFLLNTGFAYSGSSISGHNMNLCKVVIKSHPEYVSIYHKIFADPYALMFSDFEAVECWIDKSGQANIKINNLVVKDAQIPETPQAQDLLIFFASMGYINNLVISPQNFTASFSYSSHSIRGLMTSAGRMLELYVYNKAQESGLFDDAVIGFKVGWNEGGDNEFDCIIIKGFKVLCIECKAQKNIFDEEQILSGYYDKLYKITDRLGVNAQAVMITDLRGIDNKRFEQSNSKLRERWSDKVITIYKPDEIDNIAETLRKILEGNYDG